MEACGRLSHRSWVSLVSLGLRAGAVVALAIPLVLAMVFVAMEFFGIDLQRISLGALIIALGLLVDDAMITVETMVTRLDRGDDKEHAATFAYTSTAFPMLTGTLVTVAGFVPIGFARSAAGEYTFSIFAVVAIALIASWVVAVVFAPLLGVWILKRTKAAHAEEPGGSCARSAASWCWPCGHAGSRSSSRSACSQRRCMDALRSAAILPASDRPELLVDLQLPENASIYATKDASAWLDKLLKDDEDVDHWSTYVGRALSASICPSTSSSPTTFSPRPWLSPRDCSSGSV